jgi:mevalonate kinase
MRRGSGSAPAKIILLGEHAVVYGQAALAAPINRFVELDAWITEGAHQTIPHGARPLPREQFAEVFAYLGVKRALFRTKTDVPSSIGLGTSAAYAVAAIRALATAAGKPLDSHRIWQLATGVEKHHHGASSGLDPAAVMADGPILFRKGDPPSVEPVRCDKPWSFVVAVVAPRTATKEQVQNLAARRTQEPAKYDQLFAKIGALVVEGAAAMTQGNAERFGALMTENQRLLRAAGLSSPELDRWCEAALADGAWGAKLTGAGSGGAAIALAKDVDRLGQRLVSFHQTWFPAMVGNRS